MMLATSTVLTYQNIANNIAVKINNLIAENPNYMESEYHYETFLHLMKTYNDLVITPLGKLKLLDLGILQKLLYTLGLTSVIPSFTGSTVEYMRPEEMMAIIREEILNRDKALLEIKNDDLTDF
jgi:hypothetical protein